MRLDVLLSHGGWDNSASVCTKRMLPIRFAEVFTTEKHTSHIIESGGADTVCIVNLGGWGILEPWITPSIFENVDQSLGIVDEFTLTQKLSVEDASGILYSHWSTFYTSEPLSDLISF
jgi:hypothetical protein